MSARYLWAVRYQRAGWKYRQVRFYRSEKAARACYLRVTRLGYERPELAPLINITLERQYLGDVEIILNSD